MGATQSGSADRMLPDMAALSRQPRKEKNRHGRKPKFDGDGLGDSIAGPHIELILARIHARASGLDSSSPSAETMHWWAFELLGGIAYTYKLGVRDDALAIHFRQTLCDLIEENLAPVTEGRSTIGWLVRALRRLDFANEPFRMDRTVYASWIQAASRAAGALLRAADPSDLLPSERVRTMARCVRLRLGAVLEELDAGSAW
ncbi:hypothetical protein [Streptomyces sp. NBC_00233]|uniref:hypothetical protein n=1 Tax=Streptomyces sp. NBC_00233 TaxID=2975686 RepID=UPI00224FFC0E|nr:hypothetical protein [Streptomyces sp. NBC_00233]MCX5233367.1 hypothetical protein [Streptomyces sp. NBC_00233]